MRPWVGVTGREQKAQAAMFSVSPSAFAAVGFPVLLFFDGPGVVTSDPTRKSALAVGGRLGA